MENNYMILGFIALILWIVAVWFYKESGDTSLDAFESLKWEFGYEE